MNQMVQGGIPIGASPVKPSPSSKLKPKLTKSELVQQSEDSTIGLNQRNSPRSYESEREYFDDAYPENYSRGFEET
jgi:hypothetical protein